MYMCFQTFACVTCLIYTWRDSFICVTLLVYMRETRIFNQLQVLDYRVAKTHKMPYLDRSISEKEPYNHCLFCGKWPVTYKASYGSSPPCMTRAYVFSNVPVCNMTLLQVTWLVLMCDMTCSNVWDEERWGAGVETQKNVRGEIGGWGRVPFNETYAPSLSTIHDGA